MFYRPPVLTNSKIKRFRGPFAGSGVARAIASAPPISNELYELASTTGLELWLDANEGVSADGNGVSAWVDQSASGRDASRNNANGPALTPSVQNGRSALRFNNTNQSLDFANTSSLSNPYILIVAGNVNGSSYLVAPKASNRQYAIFKSGNDWLMRYFNGSTSRDSSAIASGATLPGLHIFEWDRTNSTMRFDGTQVYSGSLSGGETLGRIAQLAGFDIYAHCDIAAKLIYNAAPSALDQTTTRSNIASYYGISI